MAEILNNVTEAELAADEGQTPNLAQELFEDCDDFAKAILLKDANMPTPKDFSFDLNMISPIAQCYLAEKVVAASVDKMLKYA